MATSLSSKSSTRRTGRHLQTSQDGLTHFPLATLKDDDVEDSDDEPDETDTLARESKALRSRQPVAVKQPTGRVVGIIRRYRSRARIDEC